MRIRACWRSLLPELRALDAFRKCVRLERKAKEYPRAVPLLTGLINAYRETGQEAGRCEGVRRMLHKKGAVRRGLFIHGALVSEQRHWRQVPAISAAYDI